MNKRFYLLAAVIFSMNSVAAPAALTAKDWIPTDLNQGSSLSQVFGNAVALISIRPEVAKTLDKDLNPTLLVFKIKAPAGKLESKQQWREYLEPHLRFSKKITLNEDLDKTQLYRLETVSQLEKSTTDLHSNYIAMQTAEFVYVLAYDGMGPAAAKSLPYVRSLYRQLTPSQLKEWTR